MDAQHPQRHCVEVRRRAGIAVDCKIVVAFVRAEREAHPFGEVAETDYGARGMLAKVDSANMRHGDRFMELGVRLLLDATFRRQSLRRRPVVVIPDDRTCRHTTSFNQPPPRPFAQLLRGSTA